MTGQRVVTHRSSGVAAGTLRGKVLIVASGTGSGQLVAGGDVTIASVVNEVKTNQFNDAAS